MKPPSSTPRLTISYPAWPMGRLLAEAVEAYNLHRSPDEPAADPISTDWPQLYALTLAFCRHNLSDYDRFCVPENPDALREQLHATARKMYPWLRPDPDPRLTHGKKVGAKAQPPRVLNDLSAQLADAVSRRAQILMRMAELKRKKPADGKARIKELQSELTRLDEEINLKRGAFRTLGEILGEKCPPEARDSHILLWTHHEKGYAFGGRRDLAPNYTKSAGIKCDRCGLTVLRTKRPLDLGAGIRLICLSCHCGSVAVDAAYSWPSEQMWNVISKKHSDIS